MKNTKRMTYKAMENEAIANRCMLKELDRRMEKRMSKANREEALQQARQIVRRDHELMQEMDSRWN
jgi:hypothetical protein